MATKKCVNGHQYDSSIYGDNCPFCPSKTQVVNSDINGGKTQVLGGFGNDTFGNTNPTKPLTDNPPSTPEGGTVIRHINPTGETTTGTNNRRLVGLLVSYSHIATGKVYEIYEGRNIIGRDKSCDIPITNDNNLSSKHLLILYREAEDVFWASDQDSSNGTYINGEFVSDRKRLQTNDIIVVGQTKFVFLAIPQNI